MDHGATALPGTESKLHLLTTVDLKLRIVSAQMKEPRALHSEETAAKDRGGCHGILKDDFFCYIYFYFILCYLSFLLSFNVFWTFCPGPHPPVAPEAFGLGAS